jgi:hypothetical protein
VPGSEEFLDPYLDPETGVLRNLVGARSRGSVDDAEVRVIDIRKNVEGAEFFLPPKCRSPGA